MGYGEDCGVYKGQLSGQECSSRNSIEQNRLDILEKNNYVMPRVPTNQRMNANLKEIEKLLEWRR
jgi:hypothetical protein